MTDAAPPEATYFGPEDRPLFGIWHPPARPRRSAAVVLVSPLGYEAICAHRAYRHLAHALAEAGFATLRYDHDGTGDSAGDDRDPARVEAWIRGVHAAVDEAKHRSGCDVVALLGVRLGAAIALRASEGRSDVRAAVLWAPVSGRAYAREVRAFRLLNEGDERERGEDEDDESAGFVLTAATRRALRRLDLTTAPERVLVVPRDDLPGDDAPSKTVAASGAEVTVVPADGYAAMMQDPHKTTVPRAAIETFYRWLGDTFPRADAVAPDVAYRRAARFGAVRERIARFGEGELFGIVTEPPEGVSVSGAPLVFTNAGAIHRVGPNRMYVRFARLWAPRGMVSLRYDAPGLGDTPPRAGEDENRTYLPDPAREVADAARAVLAAGHPAASCTVVGLCSGANVAFHAGLATPLVGAVVLLNPQTFHYREGDPLDVAHRRTLKEARYYRGALRRTQSWKKALRGEVDFVRIARIVGRRALGLARAQALAVASALTRAREEPQVAAELGRLRGRGVSVDFVFSDEDPGRDYLRAELGPAHAALSKKGVFHEHIVARADHTFTALSSQDDLERTLARLLLSPRERR